MDKCKKCGTTFDENDKFCSSCGIRREYEEVVAKEKTISDLEIEADKVSSIEKELNEDKENTDKINVPKKNEENNWLSESGNSKISCKDYNIRNDEKDQDIYIESSNVGKKFHIILLFLFVFGFIGGYLFFVNNHTKSSSSTESNNKQVVDYNNSHSNKTNESSKSNNSNGYILPYSNVKPVSANDIKNMNKEKLALARNEIFARHGYVFEGEPYESYFKGKSWYKPNPKFTGEGKQLSPLERHNIKMIMKAEGLDKNLAPNYDSDY